MPKPKLAFFRLTKPGLPGFVQQHLREQVECLALSFDVVLVTEACDYGEVCDKHEPQLALFESGVYAGAGRMITNTSAHPEIPKLGFLNADAYCPTRSVFLSDMERWGVETFFTLSVAMAEYTPEIADRLFVWPNFADPRVYRDYRQPKNIPVLFTGSQATHYPWRSRVHSLVTPRYACLTTPHHGWFDGRAAGGMVQGVPYAQLLNSALVAPTCGTIAREVVRKHFEIPATRTCLVTERTRALEAAGFVDMQNVVFAKPDEVLEKLEFLFTYPEELRRVTDAGYELVQSRHTMHNRDQIRQWFDLNRRAGAAERIVQTGPFDALRLASPSSGRNNSHVISGGRDRVLLREGERLLTLGRHEEAETLLRRCLNLHFMPEPVLCLARCRLYSGDAVGAIDRLMQTIGLSFADHSAHDPDPVEWGYIVRALLCRGDLREAIRRAEQFPKLRHLELNRIRTVVSDLAGRDLADLRDEEANRPRSSVHVLPELDLEAWSKDLCVMLRACGQRGLADSITAHSAASLWRRLSVRLLQPDRRGSGDRSPEEIVPAHRSGGRVERWIAQNERVAHWREARGLQDGAVRTLAQREELRTALLIDASAMAGPTRAVLAGLSRNASEPEVIWLRDATPRFLPRRVRGIGERLPRDADLHVTSEHRGLEEVDLVLLGKRAHLGEGERRALETAKVVVLEGINGVSPVQEIHAGLIADDDYELVAHDGCDDDGYSAFRRASFKRLRDASAANSIPVHPCAA